MLKNGNHSAHELQRQKVLSQSIYGIWEDADRSIELKVSPRVGGARIKVWAVRDLSTIQRIATFCGLDSSPKRTHWEGFDLITNLEREDDYSFVNGIVNMPNNRRKNSADFKVAGNHFAILYFFYQLSSRDFSRGQSGSLALHKKMGAFNLQENA
ncbi:MAG TPA: hypothetical protein VL728_08480 [Cyclobacteriaceae bacterium]|jgi:hypothetical protein|nr:hypothetical protein [Cyclobacteriaceae bacterium]